MTQEELAERAGVSVRAIGALEHGKRRAPYTHTVQQLAEIDLLLNCARRHEAGRAEAMLAEVSEAADRTAGWSGWLWELRLAQARAEIALARGDWEEALRRAEDALAISRRRGRVKYQAAGLQTRAEALISIGRKHEAIADLRSAVALARQMSDPAMLLRLAAALLGVDRDDLLLADALAAASSIVSALPAEEMVARFQAAEPVRLLHRLVS